jgi:TPR repeat protein
MNKSLGVHYIELSADHGHVAAQHNSAILLCDGDGVATNKAHRGHPFKLSADRGNQFS